MTVAELTDWIESQFPVGDGTRTWKSVTGEEYAVVGHEREWNLEQAKTGVVREGYPWLLAEDEDEAVRYAANAWSRYSDGKTGTLYWRVKPSLERVDNGKVSGLRVYMRLLVSDKPIIRKTDNG